MTLSFVEPGRVLPRAEFATTHWSVVLAAGDAGSVKAAEALETLCSLYWYPCYAFIRRQGHSPEEAQDLTQGFFALLLERGDLAGIRREKGRFRSYLLVSLKHFLINQTQRARAEKRGGRRRPIKLDELEAEERFALEPVDHVSADKIFERRWAYTLLDRALERLAGEAGGGANRLLVDRFKQLLADEPGGPSQASIAAELGMTENAVKQAFHRFRTKYRQAICEEIARTVATPGEIEDELRYLAGALRG